MSGITNSRISWSQFTQLLTPSHIDRAETIFDNLENEVEAALALQSSKKKRNEPNGLVSRRDVILADTVKNYINRIDFGSLYQDGRVDLDKINQITADKKKISSCLLSIIMRLGPNESFGFVAEHVNNSLNGKIYSLFATGKTQIGLETKQRAETLAIKLFQGPLIDSAHNKKAKDASIDKKEAFKEWLIPVEMRIAEVAFSIMQYQIQDDESMQDDRLALGDKEKQDHADIDFGKLRNVPVSIIREWIQITDEFIKPLKALEKKAEELRAPRNLLEWNNTFNTINDWVSDVQNKKLPQRERPLSIMLDIASSSSNDPFLYSPTTPFNQPSSNEDGIPFKYFVSSLTADTLIEFEKQRHPPEIVFPRPTDLVKPYVLDKLMSEKKTLEKTLQNLCDNKDSLYEAAAELDVEIVPTFTVLSLHQKNYAQETLLTQINKMIVKEVSSAFKSQKKALLEETKRDFLTRFSEKGNISHKEALLLSLLRVQDKIIEMYKKMRTIEDFNQATQMSKYFENSVLALIYTDVMAEGPMEESRFNHWIRKVKGVEAEFLKA